MGRFTGRQLGLIDRLFQLPAGSPGAPTEYATESPIQPVHEVGRPAEIASGYGNLIAPGWWFMQNTNTHPGADTQATTVNPRTVIAAAAAALSIPPNPLDVDVWLFDQFVAATVGTLGAVRMGLLFPLLPGATNAAYRLTFQATASIASPLGAAANSIDASIPVVLGGQYRPLALPIGTVIEAQSTSTGASTVSLYSLCWVGPRGARPPGLA